MILKPMVLGGMPARLQYFPDMIGLCTYELLQRMSHEQGLYRSQLFGVNTLKAKIINGLPPLTMKVSPFEKFFKWKN